MRPRTAVSVTQKHFARCLLTTYVGLGSVHDRGAAKKEMPAPRRPRYASDPPALSPQTSLSLPSESDDGRVRSAEVKVGHLLPALDASYGRGSNELEHP